MVNRLAERPAALTSHDRSAEASRYRVLKSAPTDEVTERRSRDLMSEIRQIVSDVCPKTAEIGRYHDVLQDDRGLASSYAWSSASRAAVESSVVSSVDLPSPHRWMRSSSVDRLILSSSAARDLLPWVTVNA